MKKYLLILSVCLLACNYCVAQKEANVWCFGNNAGLNFNSGAPVAFSPGGISQYEGCSSIADSAGNLLFYSDGTTVWDKSYTIMPNGSGLNGQYSSTQAAMIIKQPGHRGIYYLFTTAEERGPNGLCYSIVDMSLNGGLGDVTVKNVILKPKSDERITAVRNANGRDIWVMTTSHYSDTVLAFNFTSAGVNATPVITSTTAMYPNYNNYYIGYMKASPNGKQVAIAESFGLSTVLFDFDNSTGIVSGPVVIPSTDDTYGVEFSPNSKILYVGTTLWATTPVIYQYDAAAGTGFLIINSEVRLPADKIEHSALQLAPDGKIYVGRWDDTTLGVINDPNIMGTGCNFVDGSLHLSGTCRGGLPNIFVDELNFSPNLLADFSADTVVCTTGCITFNNLSKNAVSYQWSFPGGNPSSANTANPTTCYANAGKYDVELIATDGINYDTLLMKDYVTVNAAAMAGAITISRDTICVGSGLTAQLTADSTGARLQWQSSVNGTGFSNLPDTLITYTTPPALNQTTYYRLLTSNSCGSDSSNVVTLHVVPAPAAKFNYTASGQQVNFNSDSSSTDVTSYSWDFGDNITSTDKNPTHTFANADTFTVCLTVYNNSNCSYTLCKNINLILTGAETFSTGSALYLYPNPANNAINLSADGLTGNYQLKIYNVLGQQVWQQPVNLTSLRTIQIDLTGFTHGDYELVLMSGNEYYSKCFVREK